MDVRKDNTMVMGEHNTDASHSSAHYRNGEHSGMDFTDDQHDYTVSV